MATKKQDNIEPKRKRKYTKRAKPVSESADGEKFSKPKSDTEQTSAPTYTEGYLDGLQINSWLTSPEKPKWKFDLGSFTIGVYAAIVFSSIILMRRAAIKAIQNN